LTSINKLATGPNHVLALKQVVRPAFEEWTSQMVYEWIEQTKLDFVKNVIKYGKIDGKTLINASLDFYKETLGIYDESNTYKLQYLVESLRDECITDLTLYGWGDNSFGQLALFGQRIVTAPVEIDLPPCFKVTQ
jgi:hypothetical protein